MNDGPIHPKIKISATFRTIENAPELPELSGIAVIDHNVSKYHADAKSEIRVRLHETEPERVIQALENAGIRLSRYWLYVSYPADFWVNPPEDCAGGSLWPDGYLSLPDCHPHRSFVPIGEPFYSNGRPEMSGEHCAGKPHVIQGGGITIVSDGLLETLRKLGAQGETAEVVYRGFNKAAYDTPQPGYKRFLVQPEYDMPYTGDFDFLPDSIPADFRICGACRTGVYPSSPGSTDQPLDEPERDIILSAKLCLDLERLRKSVIKQPIFALGGATEQWVSAFKAACEAFVV